MKQVQQDYKTIQSQQGSYYKARILAAGNTYGIDKIAAQNGQPMLSIDMALFDGSGPQIGNAYSAQCEFVVMEQSANWPRMAQAEIQVQICSADGLMHSEWLSMGKFYTDVRYDDSYGKLKIQAFDGMLKLEKTWTDKVPSNLLPSSWPITSRAWASMIQSANLAVFEDLTQLDNTVAFIGLNTASTIRDVLKSIAAANGGNWTMTTTEKLRLVMFRNPVVITTEATTDDYVWLGRSVEGFNKSPALTTVTGVHLEADDGTISEAGSTNGYQITGTCDFSDNSEVAALALSNTSGYVYRPFEATVVILDPITELGDIVAIDGQGYQAMRLSWSLGALVTADVAADFDKEVDHEYAIVNAQQKTLRKTLSEADKRYLTEAKFSTEIQQSSSAIRLAADGVYPTYGVLDEEIQRLQDQIDGNIQSWSGNVVPTLNNSPANQWTTPAIKAEHVGDLYFVNSDAGIPEAGQYYRFEENNGTYKWQVLSDSALSEALNKAAAALAAAEDAQDTADSAATTAALKGRIWVVQPTPPYSVGDLWFNSAQSEILTCMTARSSGSFVAGDWVKRNKYTDDSAFNTFYSTYQTTIDAIQNQVDQKADTFYQAADPSANWGAAVAGIAIAGVDIIGVTGGSEHAGDLWYRTTDGTTWYWNGTNWLQQDVPDEVFDKIDGKAQIYIVQPYPPYNVGDLWFNSATSDIMTCIRARESGNYTASDWEKRNKYTDDTRAEQVAQALVEYHSEFVVQTNAISAEVQKRVVKDKSETKTSFGWLLTDTAHTWYSGNQEVMKVNSSGLAVKGQITATSGYIGTESAGFAITSSSIRNGMSSLSDTTNNGVYFGTDGIALGAGKFKVTKAGAVSATSGKIGGWTLNATSLQNQTSNYDVQLLAPTSPSDSSYALRVRALNDAQTSLEDKTYIKYDGTFYSKKANIAGTITATSGEIGGITIGSSAIYTNSQTSFDGTGSGLHISSSGIRLGSNFKVTSSGAVTAKNIAITGGSMTLGAITGYSDTEHNGVYIGSSGIALGKGNFKVSSSGAVTAKNLSLTGGSINIANAFRVDSNGNLNANSGTFGGTVYASNLQGLVTQEQLANAVQNSLSYANNYKSATNNSTSTYPTYFTAGNIYIRGSGQLLNEGSYLIKVATGSGTAIYNMSLHTHQISVNNNTGVASIGAADWSGASHSFSIADTTYYQNGVSAAHNEAKANYISFVPTNPSSWNQIIATPGEIKTSGIHKYIQAQFDLIAGHQNSGSSSTSYDFISSSRIFNVDVTDIAGGSKGYVESVEKVSGVDIDKTGNSFSFDESGYYKFTYEDEDYSFHNITVPSGSSASYEITDGNVEEDSAHPYNPDDAWNVFNVIATFQVDGINKSFTSWVNVADVYNAGVDAGGGGGGGTPMLYARTTGQRYVGGRYEYQTEFMATDGYTDSSSYYAYLDYEVGYDWTYVG